MFSKIKIEDVEKFLKDNPNFFLKKSSILDQLNFPKNINKEFQNQNQIISFKDWLIEKLKLQKKTLIDNAKHNYISQKKIHLVIISLLQKKNKKDFFSYLNNDLPSFFKLELINVVTSKKKKKISDEFNLIHLEEKKIKEIHQSKNHFVMDAVDDSSGLYNSSNNKIISNAIFSFDKKILSDFPLLVFGSCDKHFISNRAYDLILFLSSIVEYKLIELNK